MFDEYKGVYHMFVQFERSRIIDGFFDVIGAGGYSSYFA